jgi:hypothetical protein
VSNCTALTKLNCSGNQLTSNALNALFGMLHSNVSSEYEIFVFNNPGYRDCDKSIATTKGWKVSG